jgi:cytochrome c biogenesis protein CcmG/thiol:disulfide interchange protein DsbE
VRLPPFFLLLGLAVMLGMALFFKGGQVGRSGQKLAYFDISALEKGRLTPQAFEGKVVVLNMFASWCRPCLAEQGMLLTLAKSHKTTLYGIAWKDKPTAIRAYLREHGNPFTQVGVDEKGSVTVALGLTGVPETFVIDKRGYVVKHYISALTPELLNDELLPLLDRLEAEDAP